MTKLLNEAMEAVAKLPEDRQDQLASILLDLADRTPYTPSSTEGTAIAKGKADFDHGKTATDEEIAAVFSRLRSA